MGRWIELNKDDVFESISISHEDEITFTNIVFVYSVKEINQRIEKLVCSKVAQ